MKTGSAETGRTGLRLINAGKLSAYKVKEAANDRAGKDD